MQLNTLSSSNINLLEKYFNHEDTPFNNRSHQMIRSHLYDLDKGVLFFIEDNNEIVATFGAIVVIMSDGVVCAKVPHRLHVRKDYTQHHNSFVDKLFEPALYDWLEQKQIYNLMQTVNQGNERAGFVSWLRHNRRRKYASQHVTDFGKQFINGTWTIQPYLIDEMQTWQYCAWVSINNTPWNRIWRDTKDISPQIVNKLNSHFKFSDLGWAL